MQGYSRFNFIQFATKVLYFTVLVFTGLCVQVAGLAYDNKLEQSVVRINSYANQYNYFAPWNAASQIGRAGSGFIVKGDLIVTNAHVVENSSYIDVGLSAQSDRYQAELVAIDKSCDLALLKVNSTEFWSKVSPVELSDELPLVRDKVTAVGFPIGGTTISYTEGIVSRIETRANMPRVENFLFIQIDAALNPGNSGGPTFSMDGKVVGVSAAGLLQSNNIGYIIPAMLVKHFIQDYLDGEYKGFPGLQIDCQNLLSKPARDELKMLPKQTGVMVYKIGDGTHKTGYGLKVGDVLLEVNGHDITNNGNVLGQGNIYFTHILNMAEKGDIASFKILRDGQEKMVNIKLDKSYGDDYLIPLPKDLDTPSYYIASNLIFQPATQQLVKSLLDEGFLGLADPVLLKLQSLKEQPEQQLVFLSKVLPSANTQGYSMDIRYTLVDKVNGKKINNLKDIVKAIKSNHKDVHIVELNIGAKVVVENLTEDEELASLRRFGIKFNASDDIR